MFIIDAVEINCKLFKFCVYISFGKSVCEKIIQNNYFRLLPPFITNVHRSFNFTGSHYCDLDCSFDVIVGWVYRLHFVTFKALFSLSIKFRNGFLVKIHLLEGRILEIEGKNTGGGEKGGGKKEKILSIAF